MPAPSVEELSSLVERLGEEASAASDAERIDLLRALESLKAAAAAAQARITVSFEDSQRAEQTRRGAPHRMLGLGIASQVALARRDSPHKGARHLGLARALVQEMPHTLEALAQGRTSEWRATILVRETAVLSVEHRARVDAALAPRLEHLGDRGVEREARKLAYRLDPAATVRRARRAHAERRISIRPAPDTMSYVTGLLPVAQGVAVHAALSRHADSLRAGGDPRSRGQIMADTFVERVTGQAQAPAVPVEVQLVMTDRALLGDDDTPGRLVGHGPVPASLGRALVLAGAHEAHPDAEAARARAWVRRVFAHPDTGELVAMESRRREFPAALRRFLVLRDEFCRTPWCDAPIRHIDHVRPAASGGATSAENGQGLCEACNQAKEAAGWQQTSSRDGPRGSVVVRTPTGHRYLSRPPEPPGTGPRAAAGHAPPRPPRAGTEPVATSVVEAQFFRVAVPA